MNDFLALLRAHAERVGELTIYFTAILFVAYLILGGT